MRIKEYFEDRKIKKLLKALSPLLRKRYGGSPPYTYAQVQTTIADEKLNKKYSDFAFFVFCNSEEYEKYGVHLEEVKRYEGYRGRLAGDQYGSWYGDHGGSGHGGEGGGGGGGGD